MIFAVLLLAQAIVPSQPTGIFSDRYSVQTKERFEAYILCFAKGAYDRRRAEGTPEAHMRETKAACRAEYESFVAGVVKDFEGSTDAASATMNARAFLDRMDDPSLFGPPTPAKLAKLPVERLVGHWRLGRGALAIDMTIQFADDGSLAAILKADTETIARGLKSWKVTSDGTKEAVFHAYFADGTVAKYQLVPSFPSEMNFINAAQAIIQRFDLDMEDNDLIVRMVTPDGGEQLRFRRQIGTTPDLK